MLLISLCIIGISCSDRLDCCTNISREVRIIYQNGAGENLINSTPELNESFLNIYYQDDNEFDLNNQFNLEEDENGRLVLTIFASNNYTDNFSTTLIKMENSFADTLVCEFELTSNSEVVRKAWLNGVKLDEVFNTIIK